jgi:uncharacterized protein (TIGR04255 family)
VLQPFLNAGMDVTEKDAISTSPETLRADLSEPLPDFANPPVSEVALSLQFEPLKGLTGPVLGLLWGSFKSDYPKVEEHPTLEPVIERFGTDLPIPKVHFQFQVLEAAPPMRVWFLNEAETELVQVQQDRFVHNWRKVTDTEQYPRYSSLRSKFLVEYEKFERFVRQENLGALVFNQVEVTFVNKVVSGEGWERHGQLSNVLTIHSGGYSDDFFKEPENIQTALRYVIPGEPSSDKPRGRLHMNVVPVITKAKRPALILTIIARCTPNGSLEDAVVCLDLAHKWIVKGFASITTKEMHRVWGRKDDV